MLNTFLNHMGHTHIEMEGRVRGYYTVGGDARVKIDERGIPNRKTVLNLILYI